MATSFDDLDLTKTYTYADYLSWEFDGLVELIKGKIFKMSPAPSTSHQRIVRELNGTFWQFFSGKKCEFFCAPFDVRLPTAQGKDTIVQPDLCVVCDPANIDARGCKGAPDLVVEILSPGNSKREMREKFEVYQEAGVKEYWMFQLSDKTVFKYELDENGVFRGLQPLVEDNILTSKNFPGLSIDLKKIFA